MNRPPLPANRSTPVIAKIPQSQSWIFVKRTDVPGEGGKNFVLHRRLFEAFHPRVSHLSERKTDRKFGLRKSRWKTIQNGREEEGTLYKRVAPAQLLSLPE